MVVGLPVARVINVKTNFAAVGALAPNTSTLLLMTDEAFIPVGQILSFASLSAVAALAGTNSYLYGAAEIWFSASPQPQIVYAGRWPSSATPAILQGGVLTPAQQVLTNFTTITNGGLDITVNGSTTNLTGINFDAQTNLNGVASVLTTAFAGAATVTWSGQNFTITTTSTGAGTAASGTYTFASNPASGDSVDINGVTITFETSGATGNQVNLGTNATATIANLLNFLLNSTNASLTTLSYSVTGNVLTITDRTAGTGGNSITISKTSTAITVSGATLTGGVNAATITYGSTGAGEDVSSLLGLTSTEANPPINGVGAMSALNAVVALDNLSTYWFALAVVTPTATDSDHVAIAEYIQATNHVYFVSTQETTALSSTATGDAGYQIGQLNLDRTGGSFNESSPYSMLGVAANVLTVDWTQPNSANTAALKQVPGIAPDLLTSPQANALDGKRYNYFADFDNGTAITQNGTMFGPAYIDEIVGLQSLTNQIQTDEYNALITLPKVPQTDAGMHILTGLNEATLAQYVANGFIAPGTWTGPSFGALNYGDFMPKGYYVFREPIALQSIGDRATRKAVPATIAIKLAGAVHTDSVLINVNR